MTRFAAFLVFGYVAIAVAGFEVGNGRWIFNESGKYSIVIPDSKVPAEKPEIGFANRLTEVITPFPLGTPRAQLKINILKTTSVETAEALKTTVEDEDEWAPLSLAGLAGIKKEKMASTGLRQTEIRLFYRPNQIIVINVEGTPTGGLSAEFYAGIVKSLDTFTIEK